MYNLHIKQDSALWFVCVFLFGAPFYRIDFPCKLVSSPQPIGTRVPGFSPARPLHTGCGNLFQALPPANSAQFGRRKSQRKSPCLHPLCLWPYIPTRSHNRPQIRERQIHRNIQQMKRTSKKQNSLVSRDFKCWVILYFCSLHWTNKHLKVFFAPFFFHLTKSSWNCLCPLKCWTNST